MSDDTDQIFRNLERDNLLYQLEYYNVGSSNSILSNEGNAALYAGVNGYEANRARKINKYSEAYGATDTPDGSKFFRNEFIKYILEYKLTPFSGDELLRATSPETATISMEKLFGKKGVELYQLALEEEAFSMSFRHAVVAKSTTHFDGPKWEQRPVIWVAGPSGCGKSYAAQSAVQVANKFLPAKQGDMTGNNVLAADGGIVREVSQIRKLAIQVANNQGYSGISDLHKKSSVLNCVKPAIQEAGFKTRGLGVVIPETFSKWYDPLKSMWKVMEGVEKLPETKTVFTRVEGENADRFRDVVAFMGSRRAWKTDNFQPKDLDLNRTDLSESKAYGAKGFSFGQLGSLAAESWFKKNSKGNLSLVITNDLILLKPDTNTPGTWAPAVQGDAGTRLFSRKAYEAWKNLPADEIKPDLSEFCKQHAKAIIHTSAQIDLLIIQKNMNEKMASFEKMFIKELSRDNPKLKKMEILLKKHDFLKELHAIKTDNLSDPKQISAVIKNVENLIAENKDLSKRVLKFAHKTLAVLNKAEQQMASQAVMEQTVTKGYKAELANARTASNPSKQEPEDNYQQHLSMGG